MQLVQHWGEIERSLPEGWSGLDLTLTLAENAQGPLVATLLAPLAPALSDGVVRLTVEHDQAPLVRRLMARLEQDNVDGTLEAGAPRMAERPVEQTGAATTTLVEAWDLLLSTLPPDWSDLYLELELHSADDVERAALRLAPANPALSGAGRLRFRVARVFGYGVSAQMMRRCLARLDGEGIRASLHTLRVPTSNLPVATQGRVWRVAGKSV